MESSFIRLCCLLYLLGSVNAVSKVVSLNLNKRAGLQKRASDPVAANLTYGPAINAWEPCYLVTVGIGTPPQPLDLIVDIAEDDTWVYAWGGCNSSLACSGGQFMVNLSSTYKYRPDLGTSGASHFQNNFVTEGVYGSDTFSIGGVSVSNLTLGFIESGNGTMQGIMGLAPLVNKTWQHRHLPSMLKAQGVISLQAYSLCLDSFGSSSSTLLLGGYDVGKFSSNLTMLPIMPDQSGHFSEFIISWTSLYVTNSSGSVQVQGSGTNLPSPVVLDMILSTIQLPQALYDFLWPMFNPDSRGFIPCDLRTNDQSLDFGFGGPGGPIIAVPYSELIVPAVDIYGDVFPWQGQTTCLLNLQPTNDTIYGFGQGFLGSAYVLHDLDHLAVGLAQRDFASNVSNIVEYLGPGANDSRIQRLHLAYSLPGLNLPHHLNRTRINTDSVISAAVISTTFTLPSPVITAPTALVNFTLGTWSGPHLSTHTSDASGTASSSSFSDY